MTVKFPRLPVPGNQLLQGVNTALACAGGTITIFTCAIAGNWRTK